jgi:aryl-alcohol dehydrogenase-like predicted oxidoreductase
MLNDEIHLGLGLISIGREWGYRKQAVPTEQDALKLLVNAVREGIRVFDTAASYGSSEERLGQFLSGLDHAVWAELFIATKAGEHLADDGTLYADHSYDALMKSIDRSFARLCKVDLLQLHKANIRVIADPQVRAALEYARRCGARHIGASVPDPDTAYAAIQDPLFEVLQLPYHARNRSMEPVLAAAAKHGKTVMVNRPFGMGELLYEGDATPEGGHGKRVSAFRTIMETMTAGVILTGTRSVEHLLENVAAFRDAHRMAVAAAEHACAHG